MKDYMGRWVTPKRVTSSNLSPPPPCAREEEAALSAWVTRGVWLMHNSTAVMFFVHQRTSVIPFPLLKVRSNLAN